MYMFDMFLFKLICLKLKRQDACNDQDDRECNSATIENHAPAITKRYIGGKQDDRIENGCRKHKGNGRWKRNPFSDQTAGNRDDPALAGKKKTPAPIADRTDKIGFFGMIFAIISSDTNIWIIPDIRTPSKMKGRDSIRILIKIVFICKRAWTFIINHLPYCWLNYIRFVIDGSQFIITGGICGKLNG